MKKLDLKQQQTLRSIFKSRTLFLPPNQGLLPQRQTQVGMFGLFSSAGNENNKLRQLKTWIRRIPSHDYLRM